MSHLMLDADEAGRPPSLSSDSPLSILAVQIVELAQELSQTNCFRRNQSTLAGFDHDVPTPDR